MLTEDLVECEKCSGMMFTRYGSEGYFQFNLCFDCDYYEQFDGYDDTTREEAIEMMKEVYSCDTFDEMRSMFTQFADTGDDI